VSSVIQLDASDDIASVRGRLETAKEDSLVLVVPRGVRWGQSPLSIRLLRYQAELLGKEIILVSSDRSLRLMAQHEGFRTLSSLRRIRLNGTQRATGAAPEPAPTERVGSPILRRPRGGTLGLRVGSTLLGLMVALPVIGGYLFLPSASVVIRPASSVASQNIDVTASTSAKGVSAEEGTIPARVLEAKIETSGKTEATGVKPIPETAAQGEVTFINRGKDKVPVSKGTRVATSAGFQFTTVADITLDAAPQSRAKVSVIAAEKGSAGNVDRSAVTQLLDTELASKVTVTNETKTSGGADRKVNFVTEQDRNNLREKVTEALAKADAIKELSSKKSVLESMYPDTMRFRVVDESFDRAVNEEASVLNLRMQAAAAVVVFRNEDVNSLVAKTIGIRSNPPAQPIPGTLRTQPLDVFQWDDDHVSFRIFGQAAVTPVIDEEGLKKAITGMSKERAEAYLAENFNLGEKPQVRLSPSWVKELPRFPWRISIEFNNSSTLAPKKTAGNP